MRIFGPEVQAEGFISLRQDEVDQDDLMDMIKSLGYKAYSEFPLPLPHDEEMDKVEWADTSKWMGPDAKVSRIAQPLALLSSFLCVCFSVLFPFLLYGLCSAQLDHSVFLFVCLCSLAHAAYMTCWWFSSKRSKIGPICVEIAFCATQITSHCLSTRSTTHCLMHKSGGCGPD